jgi:hypothetical protein
MRRWRKWNFLYILRAPPAPPYGGQIKGENGMKTWKRNFFDIWAMATIAFTALALTACPPDGDNNGTTEQPKEVQREFIVTINGKIVTIKDTRTNENDTDLEALGVISKLKSGLEEQTDTEIISVFNRGLVINVEETDEYTRFKAYNGNTMGGRLDYILSDDVNFVGRLEAGLNNVYSLPDPNANPVSCNCEATYGTLAHLGIGETCNCPATVKPCGCTEQTAEVGDINIPVRKVAGISVADMNNAVIALNTAYTQTLSDLGGIPLAMNDITAIHLTAVGKEWAYSIDGVLSIAISKVDTFAENLFYLVADGSIPKGMESPNSIE